MFNLFLIIETDLVSVVVIFHNPTKGSKVSFLGRNVANSPPTSNVNDCATQTH